MNKARFCIGLLAVACIDCGPVFAVAGVPHSPLAESASCSNNSGGTWGAMTVPYGASATASVAGSIPIYSLKPALDNPVTSWPAAGNYDFCAAFDTTACSFGALGALSTDAVIYQSLFLCSTDMNGPVNPAGHIPLTANGIPDGEFELGLLAAVLNNTYALDPAKTGGITNAEVLTAFKDNYNFFRVLVTTGFASMPTGGGVSDMRSLISTLCGPYLHTGLAMIFAGYATEGDAQSLSALNALIAELGPMGFQLPAGGVQAHTTGFASILGPDGDADGDGSSNRDEYNYFKAQGAAVTIAAQLNPAVIPPSPITGSIVINGNLSSTNTPEVTLALTWSRVSGPAITRMRFSDDGANWSAWESLKAARAHTLPGADGYKTVRVQYLDTANGRSAVFSDYILLDTTPPSGGIVINNGAYVTTSPSVTLGLTWSDGAGPSGMRMHFSDNGSTWTPWEPVAATRAYSLPLPNGYHTVRVQYLDAGGNRSPVYNDYIKLLMP